MSGLPVRTLLLQRTRSCYRVENWNPVDREPSRQTAAMKVERCGEGEDKMECGLWKRTAGVASVGERLFLYPNAPHISPDRGGERGWKHGGVETRSQLRNCSDARIFTTRVAGDDACIFARVH